MKNIGFSRVDFWSTGSAVNTSKSTSKGTTTTWNTSQSTVEKKKYFTSD